MSTNYNTTSVNPSTVYNGGNLNEVNEEDLLDNPIAIRMLINELNSHKSEIYEINKMNKGILAENEYLKASPLISLIALIVNLAGTFSMAIGFNMMNSENSNYNSGLTLVILTFVIMAVAGAGPLLYTYARNFLNRNSQSTKSE